MRQVPEGLAGGRSGFRRIARKGTEVVEFGLVLIPLLGFTGLIIDIGWGIFARSTLQHAVREGVRYAVTARTSEDLGHVDSITQVVQDNALGLLNGSAREKIKVRFYAADTLNDITGQEGSNSGGNLVEVAVEDFSWAPLLPVARNRTPLRLTARSLDRMEATPPTGAPPLFLP